MPNRILREGIIESHRVNLLSEAAELLYRRLMSIVDDYGRYEAHPALLRAKLYPLRLDTYTESRVAELLNETTAARLVYTYRAAGKVFLQLLEFRQQTRSVSKYLPPDAKQLLAFASMPPCAADAKHPRADAHLVVVVFGGVCVFGDVGVVVAGGGGSEPPPRTDPPTVSKTERKPKSVAAVIAYGASLPLSEDECRKFFEYNEARKWKLPRGAAGWVALLARWRETAAEHADTPRPARGKKSPPGAPPFDPKQPHAHTGGLPLAN